MAGASLSYHKGLELINRVLHRGQDTAIRFRTYRDFCERTGRKIEDQMMQEMREILNAHKFDAESGKPTDLMDVGLKESAEPYREKTAAAQAIEKINTGRPLAEEQVKVTGWQIESPEQTCYISIDDIGVKHQKEHQTGDETKTGVYV